METDSFYQKLLGFVLRRVNSLPDAEDIVQNVFLKAQQKNHQLKASEKFSAWMFTMTRNSIMDFHREKKKILEPWLLSEPEGYNEFHDCVSGCIDQQLSTLPDVYREAFELAEMKNVSQKELAAQLGISYSGAKSRVQRARQMLKEKLEALYQIKTDGFGNVVTCGTQASCGCNE